MNSPSNQEEIAALLQEGRSSLLSAGQMFLEDDLAMTSLKKAILEIDWLLLRVQDQHRYQQNSPGASDPHR